MEKIRQSVDEENRRRVAEMSSGERREEVRELKDRFGPGLEDLMRKRRQKRLEQDRKPPDASHSQPDPISPGRTREGGLRDEADNAARLQAMSPEQRAQEIAELEERFGSTVIDSLRQRAIDKAKRDNKHIGQPSIKVERPLQPTAAGHKGGVLSDASAVSTDDLKTKYFPDLPSEPEKMAWMRSPPPTSSSDTSVPRFDLSGRQLSSEDTRNMSTDMGLHHHGASPDLAGYTIDEILHLCQSTVTSQRITMMGVLAGLMRFYVSDQVSDEVKKLVVERGLCEQAANMAVGAILLMSKSAGVFRAAVDLFYETLGGSGWTWMTDHGRIASWSPTEQHVNLAGVAWEDVVPTFGEMLATDALAPRTATQILRILRRLAVLTEEHCELVTPLLPEMVRSQVVLRPWPATGTSIHPSTEVLALLRDLIVSSRRCAAALVEQGIIESLLRFPLTLTWDDSQLGRELSRLTIDIIGSMARYGLATSIARSGAEPLDRLREWLKTANDGDLAVEYLHLIRTWTVCATDPHKTTPEHDLTWAQVSAMGWTDDVLVLVSRYQQEERWAELVAALEYLAAWLGGAEINEVERGADQKRHVQSQLREAKVTTVLSLRSGPSHRVVGQILRLHTISRDLLSPQEKDAALNLHRDSTDPILRYWLDRVASMDNNEGDARTWDRPFELMRDLQPGSETLALDLLDTILRADYKDRTTHLDTLPSDKLQILRPLLQYAILPDLTNVIGPDTPRSDYLKPTSTLRPTAPPLPDAQRAPGLPLGNDWFFSPLNELLHSATSAALAQTPPDWDPKELDLVRATLILAQLAIKSAPRPDTHLNSSVLLFNLMKVFMLEHGQQTPTNHSDTDLFRDPTISSLISEVIALTTRRPASASSMEAASISFLGSKTPFFQWYTDFVALYESNSFGDHAFTQLLIAPLAMTYPVDFRRLFWGEHPSILRGIKLVEDEIPLEDPRGLDVFFEPVETDQAVLDGMVRAAGRGWLRENTFLRKVAVHHLASNVWSEEEKPEQKRLLMGVMSCPDVFFKEVYEHNAVGQDDKAKRRDLVERVMGARGLQRLDQLES